MSATSPATVPARPPIPAARPKLTYASIDDVIDDVRQLRVSGYRRSGTWSLPQIAWHVSVPIRRALANPVPDRTTRTPEEAEAFRKFGDFIAGRTVAQLTAPAFMQPPTDAGEAEVGRLIELLEQLKTYDGSHISMGPLGPAPMAEFMAFQLGHIAHHLSHVTPAARRREGLSYASIDDAIADVHRLRDDGYEQAGNWSLAQICWHLAAATKARMAPGPHPAGNTPEQEARKEMFAQVLATGRLPQGLEAPDVMQPPSDAETSAIGQLIETLEKVRTHTDFAPHRRFGHMNDEVSRKQILIHAVHHLSHLTPLATKRRENLRFDSAKAIVTDVETLKKGYIKAGRWTLPQAAWHLGLALHHCLKPLPAGDTREAAKGKLIPPGTEDQSMPSGLPIAPGTCPLSDAPQPIGDDEVDRLIDALHRLETFPHDRVDFGPFGVVTTNEFRQFIRAHAANHLSNFIPTT